MLDYISSLVGELSQLRERRIKLKRQIDLPSNDTGRMLMIKEQYELMEKYENVLKRRLHYEIDKIEK